MAKTGERRRRQQYSPHKDGFFYELVAGFSESDSAEDVLNLYFEKKKEENKGKLPTLVCGVCEKKVHRIISHLITFDGDKQCAWIIAPTCDKHHDKISHGMYEIFNDETNEVLK